MSGPQQFSFGGAIQAAPGVQMVQVGESLPEQSSPPLPRRMTAPKVGKPINVLAMAKTRLKEVKAALRAMKKLEKERDELERLIAAAESKSLKNVAGKVVGTIKAAG